jgi:hypothetical protein
MVAILGVAVLCQTLTRRDEGVLLAPIGFVAGVVAVLVPWPVALIGLAMAATGLFAFRQFHAFFSAGLATVACLGLVLDANIVLLVPALTALALPLVIGLLTRSTLELPVRNTSGAAAPAPAPRTTGT